MFRAILAAALCLVTGVAQAQVVMNPPLGGPPPATVRVTIAGEGALDGTYTLSYVGDGVVRHRWAIAFPFYRGHASGLWMTAGTSNNPDKAHLMVGISGPLSDNMWTGIADINPAFWNQALSGAPGTSATVRP